MLKIGTDNLDSLQDIDSDGKSPRFRSDDPVQILYRTLVYVFYFLLFLVRLVLVFLSKENQLELSNSIVAICLPKRIVENL